MPEPIAPPPAPRWIKVTGFIVLHLLLFVALWHLSGHGMGHHMQMSMPTATESTSGTSKP
jgi:hypothetical protein